MHKKVQVILNHFQKKYKSYVSNVFKRQGISNWTDTLNRIRIGEQNDEDVALLETRRMSKFEKNFDEALHVFYRNVDVNAHNIRLLYWIY